jgi:hypothetical protein
VPQFVSSWPPQRYKPKYSHDSPQDLANYLAKKILEYKYLSAGATYITLDKLYHSSILREPQTYHSSTSSSQTIINLPQVTLPHEELRLAPIRPL